ncbi:hypothetical protein DFA_07999 [Cavenderia fasciculata]|uniref:F-box domain-containing protein n=1 Tax=Cavenderia fasciculata TaxID=261658 RepID=F4Q4K9_CACFS|nr:uncharacterized protein DFA_07999 [Cavenderia fasciculata]EGG17018.1 hypothetical protein DFA_07999 [Cavenderia fasciculata]|eukprot:XP_004355502.1 hypothetical protein DFA_07999 [Cavenderia fasciculata]
MTNLPWIIQSKIIYLLCSHRQNEYQLDMINQVVFTIASVSKMWRRLTAACLTSAWYICLGRHSLEEYHRFSSHPLSLLSGANHNIQLIDDHSESVPTEKIQANIIYSKANLKWFIEDVINKTSCIQISAYRCDGRPPKWIDLIDRPLPTLKKLRIYGSLQVIHLDLFVHLQELIIQSSETTTDELCCILDNCQSLDSLDLDTTRQCDVGIDWDTVFPSIPRKITKLCIRRFCHDMPFNLLPNTITDLIVWDSRQSGNQIYYDYILANNSSVRKIHQYGLPSMECADFLSSPSSPIKHLHLNLIWLVLTTITIAIKGRPLVPPLIEELELRTSFWHDENQSYVMDSIFKRSGPLPNLHTLRISTNVDSIDFIIPLILSSRSLKCIDFWSTYGSYYRDDNLEHLDPLLEAIAKSPCIEKVYFKGTSSFIPILKTHLRLNNNNKSMVLIIDKLTLFNINNYHYDLSSFEIIDFNK